MTKEEQNSLITVLVSRYEEQLKALPFKKNVRETLLDGFRDGVRTGVQAVLHIQNEKKV